MKLYQISYSVPLINYKVIVRLRSHIFNDNYDNLQLTFFAIFYMLHDDLNGSKHLALYKNSKFCFCNKIFFLTVFSDVL
jgi:hypothetical protein